ncbi:hypothetical protein ACIQNG_02175 [Streptomyces sp. NPDC091377]|uniref:hypothetical protein n=1 Tax=Streptomyces sp. NPDC091377 TaxID=3365995 RepID=UPI00382A0654
MHSGTVWAGEEIPNRLREGMARQAEAFSEVSGQPTLWAAPRGTEWGGSRSTEELMDSYRAFAEPLGYRVVNVWENVEYLSQALPAEKRNPQMLMDMWSWDMRNGGQISVKDSVSYCVLGVEGGVLLDGNASPAPGTKYTGAEEAFQRDVTIPMIDSDASIYYTPVDHVTYGDGGMNDDNDAVAPQIDIWAMAARPGSEGQEIMRGAAESMFDRYVKMAQASVAEGDVVMLHGPEEGRFVPGEFRTNSSVLGKKANVDDPEWAFIPGELAVHSLYDGIAKVDNRHGGSAMGVPDEAWPLRTSPTGPLVDRQRTLPALNLTKTYEGSWKQGREQSNPLAYYASMSAFDPNRTSTSPTAPAQISRSSSSSQGSRRSR